MNKMVYRRYEAIKDIMEVVDDELVVCNMGSPCKELFEIKDRTKNFYMLGSLGLISSIGLGLAMSRPDKRIVVIDGDGSILMNLGSLVTIANIDPKNLKIIIIDNGAYGSTGFQKTFTNNSYGKTDLSKIANSAGIKNSFFVDGSAGGTIVNKVKDLLGKEELSVLVIKTEEGQPKTSLVPLSAEEIKNRFLNEVKFND